MIEKNSMLEERRKQEGIARTFLINTIRDTEQTQSKQKNVTERSIPQSILEMDPK